MCANELKYQHLLFHEMSGNVIVYYESRRLSEFVICNKLHILLFKKLNGKNQNQFKEISQSKIKNILSRHR